MSSSRLLLLAGLLAGFPLLAPAAAAQEGAPSMDQATAAMQSGQFEVAAASFRKILEAQPENGIAWFNLGYSLHALGQLDEAHDCHIKAQDTPQVRPIAIYNHACIHSLWGETDSAIKLLNDAVAEGFNQPQQLRTDSDMDNIRKDARFVALLKKMEADAAKTAVPAPPKPPAPPAKPAAPTKPAPPAKPAKPATPALPAVPAKPVKPAPAPAKAAPAAAAAAEKAFDFYPGEWDVVADGEVVSHLVVRRLLDGAAFEATSENSVGLYRWDAKSKNWKQTWVGRDGLSAELVGGPQHGRIVMRMKGSFDEEGTLGRSVFSNIGKDGFDYGWETSSDQGKTWTTPEPLRFQRTGAKASKAATGHAAPAAAHKAAPLPAAKAYDFKLGSWKIAGQVKAADGSSIPCTGKAHAVRKDDGSILEKIAISVENGPNYLGSTLRRYDAGSGRWLVTWTQTEPDRSTLELVGKLKDGLMVEYGGDSEDATGAFSNRVTFTEVRHGSYSARQDRLYDDGRFEVGVWTYTATRVD
ncbi:MAG: tetratricopeptide repeat protein [Planctomycetes bacterium]|nr:tetratricopeptide repeat protein [Planctomycetota bacterium]MBL7008110.1 tetratricopeptide repeat protein [Planctomycetota bacterium]